MLDVGCWMLDVFLRPFQFVRQIVQIVVTKNPELRAGQLRGVHDAGVDKLVEDDDIAFAQQRANGSEGGRVAGGKSQCGFGALEIGQRFLQFMKWRE